MKKQMFLLITVITMAVTLNATTGNPMIVKIEKAQKENTIEIRLANLQKKNTQLTVLDAEGKSWYFHNISKEIGFGTSLNMEGMPDNVYVIFIRNKNGQHFQAFSKSGNEINFHKDQQDKNAKSLTASLENMNTEEAPGLITKITAEQNRSLNVQLANLKEAPTTIRLFTDSGTNIQTVKVENEHAYARNWDMQNVADGNYFLYIETGDATVVQSITVEKNKVEVSKPQRLDF